MSREVCEHLVAATNECSDCDAAADARDDAAVLAIAPIVLGLNKNGEAELARRGLDYLSHDEHRQLSEIVATVQRVMICGK